jgi:hypothetical protein
MVAEKTRDQGWDLVARFLGHLALFCHMDGAV